MRELIYIPVVHTEADMGSLKSGVKREFQTRYGKEKWQKHRQFIDNFWEGVRKRITKLQLEYQQTYIYQDGLPVCEMEALIVTDLARQGSLNHQLVSWLIERGANLVGTESPELLLEEYKIIQGVLSLPEGKERAAATAQYRKRAAGLLNQRDDYIRNIIDSTLPVGGVGILFIGLTHQVDEGLPDDIRISYLVHDLPFKRDRRIQLL